MYPFSQAVQAPEVSAERQFAWRGLQVPEKST